MSLASRARRAARVWWSVGLAVAALVYVVLALLDGAWGTALAVEVVGAFVFVGAALYTGALNPVLSALGVDVGAGKGGTKQNGSKAKAA